MNVFENFAWKIEAISFHSQLMFSYQTTSCKMVVLLALCKGKPPITGGFPSQRPVTQSFDIFFDRRLNKWLNKQSRRQLFETLSRLLLRHFNGKLIF